jgi:hypothetical protein
MKKPFVRPELREEQRLAQLTLGTPCVSNICPA